MDEFDKIRELTEDLTNRKEPTFTGFYQTKPLEEQKKEEIQQVSSEFSKTLNNELILELEIFSSFSSIILISFSSLFFKLLITTWNYYFRAYF